MTVKIIRDALDGWDEEHGCCRSTDIVAEAAGAYADLLDSDALIIRRDENGNWPEWTRRAIADLGPWAGNADQILDALALSQGVEHG